MASLNPSNALAGVPRELNWACSLSGRGFTLSPLSVIPALANQVHPWACVCESQLIAHVLGRTTPSRRCCSVVLSFPVLSLFSCHHWMLCHKSLEIKYLLLKPIKTSDCDWNEVQPGFNPRTTLSNPEAYVSSWDEVIRCVTWGRTRLQSCSELEVETSSGRHVCLLSEPRRETHWLGWNTRFPKSCRPCPQPGSGCYTNADEIQQKPFSGGELINVAVGKVQGQVSHPLKLNRSVCK